MASDDITPCASCGDAVTTSEWHPAATGTTPGGDLRVQTFCSDACREDWLAETAASAESASPADD